MKTYSAKPKDVTRVWYVLDAAEAPLGRLSTRAAALLIGKGKPQFTSHIDVGDFVVIINADKLKVTGEKMNDKSYYRHSGYPGGLTTRTMAEQMILDSTKVIEHSVRGMLPVNKLRPDRLKRLKIYAGEDHQHTAQKPTQVSLKESK